MINVFHDDEEFACVLRCDCVPFKKEEFQAILLVTNLNIYIFKITGKESATVDPKKWAKQVFSQPIGHLRFIDYGLGYQSFHIEFMNENQCFTFVLRDSKCTKLFLTSFTKIVTSPEKSGDHRLESVSKHHPSTIQNLENQVFSHIKSKAEANTELVGFFMGFLQKTNPSLKGLQYPAPVSIVLTGSHLFLLKEDFNWPLPRCLAAAESLYTHPQFEVLEKNPLTDLLNVKIDMLCPYDVIACFNDEPTEVESEWHLRMESDKALRTMLDSISPLWEKFFGIEFTVDVLNAS